MYVTSLASATPPELAVSITIVVRRCVDPEEVLFVLRGASIGTWIAVIRNLDSVRDGFVKALTAIRAATRFPNR